MNKKNTKYKNKSTKNSIKNKSKNKKNSESNFKNKSKINSKGFLFTISIILFASTLVLYAQTYSNMNVGRETRILSNYKLLAQPILSNDLALDLEEILSFGISTKSESNGISLIISDKYPKTSIASKLSSYESFLENTFFSRVSGTESVDFTNILDGKAEIFLGENTNYEIDYNNSYSELSSSLTLSSLDLNIITSRDLISYEENFSTGDTELNIIYFDDSNYIVKTKSINPSSENTLKLVYADSNILVEIGAITQNNSFKIDTNSSSDLWIDLIAYYETDANYFSIDFDANLLYSNEEISSNSFINIVN
jgi:hypothetical protein